MAKKVLLKDIAEEVGVSTALVSYVLNNKRTNKINPKTAEKIRNTAHKKKYVPNLIAQSLKAKKTFTIGLIVADISNLFYSHIARYIEEETERFGYNVLYGSAYENPERFRKILDVMLSRQVDGLILAIPENGEDCIPELKRRKVPFVVIDRQFPNFKDYTSVSLNNYKASKEVVATFLRNGSRRPGAIGLKTNLHHLKERENGFKETARKKLPASSIFLYEVEEASMELEMGALIKRALLKDKLDALCFFTNKIAMAALPHLLKYKIKIPERLQIICFDEASAYSLFPYPIVYVKQPLEKMSRQAVQCLIGSNKRDLKKNYQFDGELISL